NLLGERMTMPAAPPAVGDLLDLTATVALATGPSAGIGRGIALRLAEAGAAVAVHYRRRKERADALVAEMNGRGAKAFAVYAELTAPAAVDQALQQAFDALGPVDILVNNAARQTHATFFEMSLDEWRGVLATNLDGV